MERIYFKDNPNLGLKVVLTNSGRTEYRCNCKKIKGEYWIKDLECIEIGGAWYSTLNGAVIFDHEKKQWVLKTKIRHMVHGIVDFGDNNQMILGYFTANPCNNVDVFDRETGNTYKCISAEIAQKQCIENISSGVYYMNVKNPAHVRALSEIKNIVDNRQKGYNIEDNVVEMQQKIDAYNAFPTRINKHVSKFSKLLHDVTFGVELECIRGYLPEYIQSRCGVVVCRDGSLHDADGTQGPEFTTIPLQGAKGVQSLISLGRSLTQRTAIDKHCALHIHLGNLPTSRIFLVTLYKLCYMIQDDMFKMFPYYKINEREYAGKDKNYCKKLDKRSLFNLKTKDKEGYTNYINDSYIQIFNWLANGNVPSRKFNRKNKLHPKANEKWNRVARYCWVNFMNSIFSDRNTIEFRIHQGTTNPQKVISWLFICNAIVKTAIRKTSDILTGKEVTLEDVLNYYGEEFKTDTAKTMSKYLMEYVKQRQEYFRNDFEKGDFMSERELQEDKYFELPFNEISEMFKN